jgi:hypothetical protein
MEFTFSFSGEVGGVGVRFKLCDHFVGRIIREYKWTFAENFKRIFSC